ncbi:MAG: DHH family phosphoesterase [Anaerolineales bacterium]|nr:DHH family phosphoesterase [Anaerolineales bacterium]MCX7756387.1 DHH family phosphoesterase [Anaerolineales bacterium]MDW8277059.1 DHH family phosphoesterase [Anaerolineales bacterium]
MMIDLDHAIQTRFRQAGNILIVCHVRPDGDAIGALLGLGLALQAAGKTVQMVSNDGIPASFRHLPGSDQVKKEPQDGFDLFVTVDCADFKRLGSQFERFRNPDINIDHHITNAQFGELNLIEPQAVATCAILTDHLPRWGLTISPEVAANLATGIITDTLGFRTSNTTPAALRQAALLMETGIDLPELYNRALVRRSYAAAKYWGAGLSSLTTLDGIVYGTLRIADRKNAGYGGNDDADLINIISAIEDHQVGMVFVEQPDSVKISWRALQPEIDVAQVATAFGGGGHKAAAGADIPGKLEEIQPRVLAVTREILKL